MNSTKTIILLFSFLLIANTAAKVSVLFHPYDDTFSAIVERLKKAEKTIDMALYNLDASQRSSIIRYLSSNSFQRKLESGELTVRLLFEGYASKEENLEKMLKIEKLGIDVKTLRTSKKMHHKFAIIDGHSIDASLITGSANWSSGSRDNYNENIFFFDNEAQMAQKFQKEFNLLWSVSKEVGKAFVHKEVGFEKAERGLGEVFFNTENFVVKRGTLYKKRNDVGFRLTKEIVRSIDNAKKKIEIATTRLKLRPIYNALL
ncbi:MAG: phospholipase D-like domain-containing protein, partial [Halobacteriovoraceae bacterium]|nr:phospholipase D-like domain-containing protein [Halobacteriovoraceae bacterium]